MAFSFSDLRPTDVLAAARRIEGLVRRTPLVHSTPLSEIVGGDVYLKLENEQITGSFKLRGATNAIASLAPDVRARGVACGRGQYPHSIHTVHRGEVLQRQQTAAVNPAATRDGGVRTGAWAAGGDKETAPRAGPP